VLALVLSIITILAPGILLALIGLAWQKSGTPFPIDFVTRLVVNVSLPALLFQTLATAEVSLDALGTLALAALSVHFVFASFAVLALRGAGKDWRLGVAHVVGNTGNLGLPICLLAFGELGLAYAVTFFAVQCVLMFTLGDAIYAGSFRLVRALRSPVLHAIWLGLLTRAVDMPLPAVLMETVGLLGQIVIPLMLITLGVSLAGMRVSALPSAILWSSVRTLAAIAIGFGVAEVYSLEGVARGVLILQAAMPVAVFNFLLAEKHGRDSGEVSSLILVTHLGAILYLPVLLGVLL